LDREERLIKAFEGRGEKLTKAFEDFGKKETAIDAKSALKFTGREAERNTARLPRAEREAAEKSPMSRHAGKDAKDGKGGKGKKKGRDINADSEGVAMSENVGVTAGMRAVNVGKNIAPKLAMGSRTLAVKTARGTKTLVNNITGRLTGKLTHSSRAPLVKEKRSAKTVMKKTATKALKFTGKTAKRIAAAPVSYGKSAVKNKIKSAYQGAYRDAISNGTAKSRSDEIAGSASSALGRGAKKGAKIAAKAVKKIAGVLIKLLGPAAAVVLLIVMIVTAVLLPFMGGGSGAVAGAYQSSARDIEGAEEYYQLLEAELALTVARAESDNSGYDEYDYAEVDDIGHNMYELLALMTVKLGDFKWNDAATQAFALDLFNRQYAYTTTPVTITVTEYVWEDVGEEGAPEWELREVEYETEVLHVRLTNTSIREIARGMLNDEEKAQYNTLMQSKGLSQAVSNPFGDVNWSYMTDETAMYGHYADVAADRVEFREGVRIYANAGTDVNCGLDGKVIEVKTGTGDNAPYVIVEGKIQLSNGDEEEDGEVIRLRVKYGGLTGITVSEGAEVKTGDVIGKTGADGLYLMVKLHRIIGTDTYLNPFLFVDTGDTSYIPIDAAPGEWPEGMPLPVYGVAPPRPSAAFLSLFLDYADDYLGTPYTGSANLVSNPPTTFNCASFVSYVMRQSGHTDPLTQSAAALYYTSCVPITEADLAPGDLVFFHSTYDGAIGRISHVGIYLGDDTIVHSGSPNRTATLSALGIYRNNFYSFARIVHA
jgi:hypothetical protein